RLPRPPRSRLPPPPPPNPPRFPPPLLGSIGRASLTVNARPSCSVPFNLAMASFASASVDISTKPKPLLRPVSRSVMIFADSTVPNAANISEREVSLIEKGKLPTYSFLFICFPSFEGCCHERGSKHHAEHSLRRRRKFLPQFTGAVNQR